MPKVRKAELSFLYATTSHPSLHFYQIPSKYSKGYLSYRADMKSISNKTKGDNSKSKKARVIILVHDTSSCPVLHFYQYNQNFPKGIQVTEWTRSCHSCMLHVVLSYSKFLPSIIKIFQRVFDLQNGHEINA